MPKYTNSEVAVQRLAEIIASLIVDIRDVGFTAKSKENLIIPVSTRLLNPFVLHYVSPVNQSRCDASKLACANLNRLFDQQWHFFINSNIVTSR